MHPATSPVDPPSWDVWLDTLEEAIVDLEHALAGGEDPRWPDLPEPVGEPPEGSAERRRALADRMVAASLTLERNRAETRLRLAALPPRPQPTPSSWERSIGVWLDIVS
jgi:hypothetical protein